MATFFQFTRYTALIYIVINCSLGEETNPDYILGSFERKPGQSRGSQQASVVLDTDSYYKWFDKSGNVFHLVYTGKYSGNYTYAIGPDWSKYGGNQRIITLSKKNDVIEVIGPDYVTYKKKSIHVRGKEPRYTNELNFDEANYVIGYYERKAGPFNNWHYVNITKICGAFGEYKWTNKAGHYWHMYYTGKLEKAYTFATGTDSPYFGPKHKYYTAILSSVNGNFEIIGPHGTAYKKKGE